MTAASSPQVQQMLDDRYGRSRRRVWPWALAAVAVAGVLVWYAWGTVVGAMDSVDVDTTGYDVTDARTVTVHFQATVRSGAPLACALEAQDDNHGIVGFRVVEFAASETTTRTFTETVPTLAEATTGLVTSCWIP